MPCEQCGGPALEPLCVYCSGARPRAPETVITGAVWAQHLHDAAELAAKMLASDRLAGADSYKPGLVALAHMIAAQAVIATCPGLPSFEWYAAQVLKVVRR